MKDLKTWCSEWLEEQADGSSDVRWYEGYAEPGYDEPELGVVLANWNDFSEKVTVLHDGDELTARPGDLLEQAGYSVEWCDEWTDCCNCYKLIRTSPDSFFWQPSYFWPSECEIQCKQCALADMDSYADWVTSKDDHIDNLLLPWEEHGWAELPSKFWWIVGVTAGATKESLEVAAEKHSDDAVQFVIQHNPTILGQQYRVFIRQPQQD